MRDRIAYISLGEIASYSRNADERQIPKALARDFDLTFFNPEGFIPPAELHATAHIEHVQCLQKQGAVTKWGRLQYAWGVFKVLRKRPVDAVCSSHGMVNYLVGYMLSLGVKGKWVIFCWDPPALTFRNRNGLLAQGLVGLTDFLFRMCVGRCARLVLNIHSDLLRAMGFSETVIEKKVLNLPNGVDGSELEAVGRRCCPDPFRIGVVSVASSIKGFEFVVEAFLKAATEAPRLTLRWIGECTEANRTYADTLSAAARVNPNRITFTGVLAYDSAMEKAAECGMCVYAYQDLPNFRWNYVLKAGEYMALGRCVVAVNLPGVREYVRQGETGMLVPPGDSEALAQVLLELASNPEKQEKLGRQAQAFIRQYAWDDITHRITDDISAVIHQETCTA